MDTLVPLAGCSNETVVAEDSGLRISAKRRGKTAVCPDCGRRSRWVHSRYTRSPADLPVTERRVRLHLLVRRFRCLNPRCERRTFAEAFPDLVLPHAQRTIRLAKVQAEVGIATSGESGARLLGKLHMPTSADTLLRLIRCTPLPEHPTPRVLGVDDWSFRRGKTFGTILVDLEKHDVVDLLPDRTAATLTEWLKQHPDIEIISRDRSGEYARAANEGAPQAVQVADRWHVLKNLGDMLQDWLERHRNYLLEPTVEVEGQERQSQAQVQKTPSQLSGQGNTSFERSLLAIVANRERRLELYRQAETLKQQGFSTRAIAKKLGKGRSTIKRLLDRQGERKTRVSQLAPFIPYLNKRWEEGMVNRKQLYREILEQGFTGSYLLVYSYFAARQAGLDEAFPSSSTNPKGSSYTPSEGRRLFTQRAVELETVDQARLDNLFARSPEAEACYTLGQTFLNLFRQREQHSTNDFDDWLQAAQHGPVIELRRFAKRLAPDRAAVEAAITLPYSNGQVEGQVTKLKLIKRSMYGRANFDLLRRRVLLA